jgi:hypothetical protein
MSFTWFEAKDAALRVVGRTPDDWKGKQAFSNWAVHGWLWQLFEYALPGFVRRYIQKLFDRRCNENMQLMRGWAGRALMKQLSMEALSLTIVRHDAPHSRKEIRWIRILSFGCGPGTDAVALVEFLRQQLPKLFPGVDIRFKVTLVDAVIEWKASALAAVRTVLKGTDGLRFIHGSWEDDEVFEAAVSPSS